MRRLKNISICILLIFSIPLIQNQTTRSITSGNNNYLAKNKLVLDEVKTDYSTYSESLINQFVLDNNNLVGFDNITGTEILNNTSFLVFSNSHKVSGSGTKSDPIIFRNLQITSRIKFANIGYYFIIENSYFHSGNVSFENSNLMNMTSSLFNVNDKTEFNVQNHANFSNNIFISNSTSGEFQFKGQFHPLIKNNIFISLQKGVTTVRIQSFYNGTFVKSEDVYFENNTIFSSGIAIYSFIKGFAKYSGNNIILNENSISLFVGIDMIIDYNHNITDNFFQYVGKDEFPSKIQFRKFQSYTTSIYIERNYFDNFQYAVEFKNMKNLHIRDNNITNSDTGFWFSGISNQIDITRNIFQNTNLAYYLRYSSGNIISNSSITDTNIAADMFESNDNLFNYTRVTNVNWFLYSYVSSNNNTDINTISVNVKNIGLVLENDQEVDSYVSNNTLSGDGSSENPYIFKNINFNGGIGIRIDTNYTLKFENIFLVNISTIDTGALVLIHSNNTIFENIYTENVFSAISLSNTYNISLSNLYLNTTLSNPIDVQYSGNIHLNNVTIDTSYNYAYRFYYTENITIDNSRSFGINLNNLILEYSNNIYITNTELISGNIGLYSSVADKILFSNSTIANVTKLFSSLNTKEAYFNNNTFDKSSQMSYIKNSVTFNFTSNIFSNSINIIFNATHGTTNFKNNYFINNGPILFATGSVMNFEGNYYSDLNSTETSKEVISSVYDTSPLRPYIFTNPTTIIEYESGDTNYLENIISSFKIKLNYSNIFLGQNKIGYITWNGYSPKTVNLDYTSISNPRKYDLKITSVDIYGVSSTNESLTLNIIDTIFPLINSPLDILYSEGDTGNYITWSVSDLNLANYSLYINNELNMTKNLSDETSITISVDGLTVGEYNYTLVISDFSGNIVSDYVLVTVNAKIINPTTESSNITTTTKLSTKLTDGNSSNDDNNNNGFIWGFIVLASVGGGVFAAIKYQDVIKNTISKIKSNFNKKN